MSILIPLVGGVDAGRRNASLSAVEPAPFGKDLWILDSGTNFDMCPTDTLGFRTKRGDLGCVISATGSAFPDHTITTCIDALQEEAECVPLDGLTVRLLAVGKRCRRDGCRYCWEPFAEKPTYTDPNGIDVPTVCLPDSDVAAIVSTASHPANNARSKLRRSPCMQAVRFCCPAYAGLHAGDPNPDSDALQPSGGDESVDVVLDASPEFPEAVEQGGCKSSEAVDAELISAIDVASEPDTPADVSGLKNFLEHWKVAKPNLMPRSMMKTSFSF